MRATPLLRQLGWLLTIWTARVATLAALAWLMRQLMAWGGMTG